MRNKLYLLLFFLVPLYFQGQERSDYFVFKSDSIQVLPGEYDYRDFVSMNGDRLKLKPLPDGQYVEIIDGDNFAIFTIEGMVLNGQFERYSKGELYETGFYLKGSQSEIWKTYRNGALESRFYYKHNTHSEFEIYFENGSPKSRGIIIEEGDDYKITLETVWYPNGNKKEQGLVKIDTKCHTCSDCCKYGTWTYWHENGVVKAQGEYKKTKEEGLWVYSDSTGQSTEEIIYNGGKIRSSTKSYREEKEDLLLFFKDEFDAIGNLKRRKIDYFKDDCWIIEYYNKKGKLKRTKKYCGFG